MDLQTQLQNFLIKDAEYKGSLNEQLKNYLQRLVNIDNHLKDINGAVQENTKFRLENKNILADLPQWQDNFSDKYSKLSPKINIIMATISFFAGALVIFLLEKLK